MTQELSLSLPGGIWQRVREVRARVADLASGLSAEARDAAVMATAELVENAIKYGENVPGCENVQVRVTLHTDRIEIEVSNGISTPSLARELLDRIDQIQQSDDREALYIGRLSEMLTTPGMSGKLGLYRISYEGQCELSCTMKDQVLRVCATRALP